MAHIRGYDATCIFRGEEKNVLFRCMLFGSVLKVQISLPSSVACASIVGIIGVGMGEWNMHKLSQIQIVYE